MSNRKRARENENKAKEYWESRGYVVEITRPAKFQQNDFFNLFDLVCIKKGEKTIWIQVKTNQSFEKRFIDPIKEFKDKWFDEKHSCFLMIWSDDLNDWKMREIE